MKTIQKYISIFFLTSCMLVTTPTKAMDKIATQIKDTVIASPYVSASIVAGILIGSCLYLKKRFFGRSVTVKPSIEQDVKLQETLVAPAKEITMSAQTLPIEQTVFAEPMETIQPKPACPAKYPVVTDNQETQTTQPEQTSPVVDENQVPQIIKVVNHHNQSLNFRVSSADDNDELVRQFSVPGRSNGLININR